MRDQSDVINAVCGFLESEGYLIPQSGAGQSPNIIATRDGRRILIEARGNTSANPKTARYGEPFDRGQVTEHVAQIVYKALKLVGAASGADRVALALPHDELHAEAVGYVEKALRTLTISIYWVDEEGNVATE